MNYEGGPDPTVILNALAEMQKEIIDECSKKYAPLVDFKTSSEQLQDDINNMFKRL